MKQGESSRQRLTQRRYIIADDHDLVRIGLRHLLDAVPGLELIGEATNGREAVDLCRQLQPDLALIDVQMPELDGLDATRAIRQDCPATSVIIVTAYDDPRYLLEALDLGVVGYVLKGMAASELLSTVQQVLNGESAVSLELASRTLRQLSDTMPSWPRHMSEQLTPRERDVLQLIAQGQTNREIAFKLSLSAGTVKTYVERVIAKLGAADRTQAAVRAVELGLIALKSRHYPCDNSQS